MERMGHSSKTVTVGTYGHLFPDLCSSKTGSHCPPRHGNHTGGRHLPHIYCTTGGSRPEWLIRTTLRLGTICEPAVGIEPTTWRLQVACAANCATPACLGYYRAYGRNADRRKTPAPRPSPHSSGEGRPHGAWVIRSQAVVAAVVIASAAGGDVDTATRRGFALSATGIVKVKTPLS